MKPQHMIDNEQWGELCQRISGRIDDLCSHELSKTEFYEALKCEVEYYRKKTQER